MSQIVFTTKSSFITTSKIEANLEFAFLLFLYILLHGLFKIHAAPLQ